MRNLKQITFVSIPLSPIAELFERYVFGDWEFVKFLTILICLDTVLGFLKHYLAHDVDSRAFAMIVKKLIAVDRDFAEWEAAREDESVVVL